MERKGFLCYLGAEKRPVVGGTRWGKKEIVRNFGNCLFHFQMCGALLEILCWDLGWSHQTSVHDFLQTWTSCPKFGFSVRGPVAPLWTVSIENRLLRQAGPESAKHQQLCLPKLILGSVGLVMRGEEITGCPATRPSGKIAG